MALWIVQALVDLLLVNVALLWVISRKRTRFLEAQMDRLDRELNAFKNKTRSVNDSQTMIASTESLAANSAASLNATAHNAGIVDNLGPQPSFIPGRPNKVMPTTPAPGSIVEKRMDIQAPKTLSKAEAAEAYDRATQMLARGMNAKDVSRLTGLSVAELQLMGKISLRTQ